MGNRILLLAVAAETLAFTACSHSVPVTGGEQPTSSISASREGPRWTTRFRSVAPTHLDSGDSTRHSSSGTAEWTPGESRSLSKLHLRFTYTGPERDLSWAVLYGTCGTASLPVIPMSNFPEIDVSSGGTAEVNATLAFEFPFSGTYHAEIYKDRVGGEEAVVACGDLKYVSG